MSDYYSEKLSAERLRKCYEVAPPRVQQYLEMEILHVLDRIRPTDIALELGCGYGRVLSRLANKAHTTVGIDTSQGSLILARANLSAVRSCHLVNANAIQLAFPDDSFDAVVCIQNGISAFHVDHRTLLQEAVRVTRPRGVALFSSYSDRFWEDRIEWFRIQAAHGLVGEIDEAATGNGVIVCKDGFRGNTVRPNDFRAAAAGLPAECRVFEVDGSSVFCELRVL
jgi:2-polyprenyl-6-hydroxyphenyl methylase/3-demethylubiquinone-9 3-methyltransferase